MGVAHPGGEDRTRADNITITITITCVVITYAPLYGYYFKKSKMPSTLHLAVLARQTLRDPRASRPAEPSRRAAARWRLTTCVSGL